MSGRYVCGDGLCLALEWLEAEGLERIYMPSSQESKYIASYKRSITP